MAPRSWAKKRPITRLKKRSVRIFMSLSLNDHAFFFIVPDNPPHLSGEMYGPGGALRS